MEYLSVFNIVEGAWWLFVAAAVAVGGIEQLIHWPIERRILVVAFVSFGISDFIEVQTGAWWRPWPLLALKSICIVVFIACVVSVVMRTCGGTDFDE